MTVIQAILNLLKALPDIVKLLQTLQQRIDEAGVDRKVSDDVKTIGDAFNAKDAAKLNALFNKE